QLGLRVEQTNSNGVLTSMVDTDDDAVKRNYLDFFPSLGLNYQFNDKNSFQLQYSRRINRPSYQDLNPFEGRLDELTFQKGNPFLNPEYANKLSVTHTWNHAINTSFSFSHTSDKITRIIDVQDITATFITWLNLENQYDYTLTVGGAIPITKWWSSYTNLMAMHLRNRADFGEGRLVDFSVNTFQVYSQHSFQLPGNISLEVSGWYMTPSLWEGTFKMEDMGSVDVGLQKKILDGRANIKLSFSDVFLSQQWRGASQFGVQYMNIEGGNDTRRIKLNFSYLFGNNQVKSRRRNTGLEDETRRIKSGD
ncbi:MAG: outer membrane beta-barrel family protein, partial [Bacteroidota bacterium]